jgi:hypothetical protein
VVPIVSLWVPILVSAVIVFVVSSILHMVLPVHRSDYRKLPDENGVMDALRKVSLAPGDYVFPHVGSPKELKDPAFVEKRKKGPVGFLTVTESGEVSMGPSLAQWFLYSLVVGVFAAYVAGRALGPGAHYLKVFRFAGVTAFIGYSLALWQNTIWYKRDWVTTLKANVDGLVYGLLTAGTFGWLWPK